MQDIEKRDVQCLFRRLANVMHLLNPLTYVESSFRDRVVGIANFLDGEIIEESKSEWLDFAESILQFRQVLREAKHTMTYLSLCGRYVYILEVIDLVLFTGFWYIAAELSKRGGIEGSLLNMSCRDMCCRAVARYFQTAENMVHAWKNM